MTNGVNFEPFERILGKGQKLNVFQQRNLYNLLQEYVTTTQNQIRRDLEREFNEKEIEFIDTLFISLMYVLHFGDTRFGKKRLDSFMKDLTATINMFKTGEYSIKDYIRQLEDEGFKIQKNIKRRYEK